MNANPLAGIASTLSDLAKTMTGRPLVTPPARVQPNSAAAAGSPGSWPR